MLYLLAMNNKGLSSSIISVSDEEDAFPKRNQKSSSKSTKKYIISESDDSDASPSPIKQSSSENDGPKASLASPSKKWVGPDFKLDLKPLGFDKNLVKWIEDTKNNPIISSGVTHVSFDLKSRYILAHDSY